MVYNETHHIIKATNDFPSCGYASYRAAAGRNCPQDLLSFIFTFISLEENRKKKKRINVKMINFVIFYT